MALITNLNYKKLLNNCDDEILSESDSTVFEEKKPNWDQSIKSIELKLTPSPSKEIFFENASESSDYALFLAENEKKIDYANVEFLIAFLTPYGEILPRIETGISLKSQRKVAKAIRRARANGFIACTYR